MRKIWRALAIFAGIGLASMLWFWLAYGGRHLVCAGQIQSLFIAGSTLWIVLAVVWAALSAFLIIWPARGTPRYALTAFLLGSVFHTFHQAVLPLWPGVNLALSALAAILTSQFVLLSYLYASRPASQQLSLAARAWATLSLAGLAGVLITSACAATIPCEMVPQFESFWQRLSRPSVLWFILWGVLPTFITAVLYAGEHKMSRE